MPSVITFAGEQLFAAKAQANEQLDIDTFIFANVPGQDPAAPINREEGIPTEHIVHQQIVQQVGRINENVVVYSTVLDSVTGPFEFNWVGLYSSVNQKLVAINHVPTVTKTVTELGTAGNTLNRNFGIEYSGIAELAGITVAPETWQLDFTARLTGMDELTRKLAADMNGKDWFIGDGFKVEPRTTINTFKVTAGAGYVSGLRVEMAADHILTLSSYPQFVYVDAWFDGTSGSQWKGQIAFTVTNTEMDDYVDVTGKKHFVFKLANITAADAVTDLRDKGALSEIEAKVSEIDLVTRKSILASNYATKDVMEDQSLALQEAWQFAADNNLPFIIDAVYWVGLNDFNPQTIGVNRPTALHVVSNSEVYFTPEAAIKLLPTAEGLYYVLNFYTAENVKIYNPVVYGDRFTHTGVDGESGNCFNITTCKDIYLHKPKAYDAWGDGFYIGREFFTNIADPVENITLFEPKSYNASRNDISLCHGHDIEIIRPRGEGAFRIAPGAAIDIEPEFGDSVAVQPTLRRVVIDSPVSIGKVSGIMTVFNRPISDWDVSIVGSAIDYDSSNPLNLIRNEDMISSVGSLNIDEFKSVNSFGNPLNYSWFADNTCKVNIGRLVHTKANRGDEPLFRQAIVFNRPASQSGDLSIGQVVNAGSPNCLEPFRISSDTAVQHCDIGFVSQGRGNNGGITEEGAVFLESNKMSMFTRTMGATGLTSADFYAEQYDINTAALNISFELSGRVRAKQKVLKTASANTLTLTASASNSIFKLDGTTVSSLSATSLYSYLEFMDDGSGNKIITAQRGNWA